MTEERARCGLLNFKSRYMRLTAFMLILAMLITGLPVSGFNLKEVKAGDPAEESNYVGGMQYYDFISQKWSDFLWYRTFEELWQAAVNHPYKQVYVKLFKDIRADDTNQRSFGKGKGFKDGAIYVPDGCSIRLDLAGHVIDRHLTLYDKEDPYNFWKGYSVIRVESNATLTVEDSKPYVQHNGYYDESLGIWFPENRYWELRTYPTRTIDLSKVVPIYGGIICGGAARYGGGIHNNGRNAVIILDGGNIVGNVAKYGGGIGDDCCHVKIRGGMIGYNYAVEYGGGVFTKSAENKWRSVGDDSQDLIMTGGVIMRNTCKNRGGGVYADCTDHAVSLSRKVMQFNDGVICANTAKQGGGLFQNQGRVELNGGLINGNWATDSGGGVVANGYMNNPSQGYTNHLFLDGVTITENTANYGGGLWVNCKKCKIGSATIMHNLALSSSPLPGGGIYISDNDFLQFTGGKIIVQDNYQGSSGGTGSNISCENHKDFNGESDVNYKLASGSCIYINFRKKTLEEGLTFGDYLSGTPGSIQLDDDRFYAVPNAAVTSWPIVSDSYWQNWKIKKRTGNEPAALVGDKEYTYTDKNGTPAKAVAKRGEFGYTSALDARDMRSSYYYTDAFFTDSRRGGANQGANEYDQHLATMSAALAMSAFRRPYKGAENQGKNVKELMEDLGMSDIELTYPEPARKGANDYTIGYAIGKKVLTEGDNKGKTLIAIATRGANYMTEWGSNTTLNYRGYYERQAAGFSDAADKVTRGVRDYLGKHGVTGKDANTIFWITGYSRGGATANLTAQRLTDRYNDNNNGNGNRVYAYPIEAPQGAYGKTATGTAANNIKPQKDPGDYKNIHNIINPSDLVPLVAPKGMGFSRFGVDHLIPGYTEMSDNSPLKDSYMSYDRRGRNTGYRSVREEAVRQLASIDSRIGFNDRFQYGTMSYISNKMFNDDLININGKMDSAENWYGDFLNGLIHYALVPNPSKKGQSQLEYRKLFSQNKPVGIDKDGAPKFSYGDKSADKVSVQTALETAIVLVFGLDKETSDKLTNALGRCSVALDKGFKCSDGTTLDMGTIYTQYIRGWSGLKTNEKNVKIKELWELVSLAGLDSILSKQQYEDFRKIFPVLVEFAMSSVANDYDKTKNRNLGTLLGNAEAIAQAHYPEVNFAWLRAQDTFFKNDGKDIYIGRKVIFDPVKEVETTVTDKDGKAAKKSTEAEVYDTYLEEEIRVKLSTKTSGAKIFYTLNGEDPKLRSHGVKVYDAPIRLTSKQGVRKQYHIRMVAFKDGVYSPEKEYRCDVYPGGEKYTLTVRYEGDRSETFRLRAGDTVSLVKATKDKMFRWRAWNPVTYSAEDIDVSDWDEIYKKKNEAFNKQMVSDTDRYTMFRMPACDTEIEGVYDRLADNLHIQYEPHTKFTKDSRIEWCVETDEGNFCSLDYVLPADANEDDYTRIDAYPSLTVDNANCYHGEEYIRFNFVPSDMSFEMPDFIDGFMDLYINDVLVCHDGKLLTKLTDDGTPYGYAETYYRPESEENAARVTFYDFPLTKAEFGKTDNMFVFKNGTPAGEIYAKLPQFTNFKAGGRSYLIQNIWPQNFLDNYDPESSKHQKYVVYAEPDEEDFAKRYPGIKIDDLKIFEKYRAIKPKCTIAINGYLSASKPWIDAIKSEGETGDGTKDNPYKKTVKIKITSSAYNKDLENRSLHYSLDGGKTYKTCADKAEIPLNDAKIDENGCLTVYAYESADRVWNGRSVNAVQKIYIKPTRTVDLKLAVLWGMFKNHYGKRWSVSDNGICGKIEDSPANESVYLNGVIYYSRYKDVGLIRQYSVQYGSRAPEVRDVKNSYSGLESISLGDITRDSAGNIENVTIAGVYDLGIDKVKIELDEDEEVERIFVHTYVDEDGNKPADDAWDELLGDEYTYEWGDDPNELTIKLTPGKGYSWCTTGTIKKAADDTVIGSLYTQKGSCSYDLRVVLSDEHREYPVWIEPVADDDPSGNAFILDYYRKGETVGLSAPEWESHTFSKWTAPEGVTITDPESADDASFTMSANEVRIKAEYERYRNIDELTVKIPKVLAYNELPDGSTVSADTVSGNVVATASLAGWQDKSAGFNKEVKAAVKLVPQMGYEFRAKSDSKIGVDTNFKVKIGDAAAVDNAVIKASLLDDGSVLAIIKQTTDKGRVNSVEWGTTEISVSDNAIESDDDLLDLVPDKVTVKCDNPKGEGDPVGVTLGVDISGHTPLYAPEINEYEVSVILKDGEVKTEDLDFATHTIESSCNYHIYLIDQPLNVKSIDWGNDDVIGISKDATKTAAMSMVPDELWVTFTRESNPDTGITMSVPVKKDCISEPGTFIVTVTLDIEPDAEGTQGYTNTEKVTLTHNYQFEVPDYHSVYVKSGTASGYTERTFDEPDWIDGSSEEAGELKWVEEGDIIAVTADDKDDFRFVRWEATGIELEEDEITDPVLYFAMEDEDVSLTAVYDKAIDDISPEISQDRKSVVSVTINGSGSLDRNVYTATVSGNNVSLELKKGHGWFFGDDTKLNENEVALQSIIKKSDYSADFVMVPEKLYVALTIVTEDGAAIYGTEETHLGIYEEGNKVYAACPDVDGYKFKEWRTDVEGLELKTGANNSVTFTMPGKDVGLRAVYVPYDDIDYVTMRISTPQAGKVLPAAAVSAEAEGGSLDDEKTGMIWTLSENEIPDYGEEVVAIITLVPDETSRFTASGDDVFASFLIEEGDEYREADDAVMLPDGSVEVYVSFIMDKRRLTSIDWGETDITGGQTVTGELAVGILPDAAELKFADAKSGEDPVIRLITWPSLSDNSVSDNRVKKVETDEAFIYTITGELDLGEDIGEIDTDEEDYEEDYGDETEEWDDEESYVYYGWLDPGSVSLKQEYTVTLLKEPKPNKPYVDIAVCDDNDKVDVTFVVDEQYKDDCKIHYDYAFAVEDEELNVPEPTMSDPAKTLSYNSVTLSDNKVTISVNKAEYTGRYVTFGVKAITETHSQSQPEVTVSSNTASENVEFYVPGGRTLSVNMVDTDNRPCEEESVDPYTGETVITSYYAYDMLTDGSQVDLLTPTIKDASFFRWEVPEGITVSANASVVTLSGNTLSGNTLSENNVNIKTGLKGYTNRYITLTMPNSGDDLTQIYARYKQLVKKVSVDVDVPAANKPVEEVSVNKVTIAFTDEYEVDPGCYDVRWSGTMSENGVDKFDPDADEYSLDIELKPDSSGKVKLKALKDSSVKEIKAEDIMFAPAAQAIINGETDDYAFLGTDEGNAYILCSFENALKYESLDDGPDKDAVIGTVIDNVFGMYKDEEGLYEYSFDKYNIENAWQTDISDKAGRTLYVRYKADESGDDYDDFDAAASKWTEIELPQSNDSMPDVTYDWSYGTLSFENVDKWQYRLSGQSEWNSATSSVVSPDELGWDGTMSGIEVRRAGDAAHFPGPVSQIVLKARPEAPAGFTLSDNSASVKGTVTGTFLGAAGKTIEVQVRYPDRSDDWTDLYEPRIITVEDDGRFTVNKLADSKIEIRIRVLDDGEMPSQWATSLITIDKEKTIGDEELVEQKYSVSYIFEYGGKRAAETKTLGYVKNLGISDGNKYGISANRKWFDGKAAELLDKDKGAVITGFVIKGRAECSDGSDVSDPAVKDKEVILTEIKASAFYDDPKGYVYNAPLQYNEINVYAIIGSYATVRDTDEGVYINSPLPVTYTGLVHKLAADPASAKKNAGKSASYDLGLVIKDTSSTDEDGDSYELVYGKDYTVKYKNNKNASVRLDPATGEYTPIYTDAQAASKKSPQMIITGKGNYKGMKSVVYFDILPLSLNSDEGAVGRFKSGQIGGAYVLKKNGGINLNVKPVRYGRSYDPSRGGYQNDIQKQVKYGKNDMALTLQMLKETTSAWEDLGSLSGKALKSTLKKVVSTGQYRVKYTGTGNFYGVGGYDTFEVYDRGKVLFSSLKVKTAKKKYAAGGVSANELVTGIKTSVKNAQGKKVKLTASDYDVELTPLSDSARVSDDNSKAMSAGVYTATVSPNYDKDKYPALAGDGSIKVTVTVTGSKLKSNMVSLDWAGKGEAYDGKSKDVTISLKGVDTSQLTLAKEVILKGKKQYIPLDEEELKGAVVAAGDKLTVKGCYDLEDGRTVDNTLPGTYTLALLGKEGFGGSLLKVRYKRVPVKLSAGALKAMDASFNISGIRTQILISENAVNKDEYIEGTGDANYSVKYGKFNALKGSVSGNRIGTVTATVKVKSDTTGYKKGSSAKVTFDVYASYADVYNYSDFDHYNPGALFVRVAGDVKNGSKPPKFTVYQASADGKKLKKLPGGYYKAEYVKEETEDKDAAPGYSIKLTGGKLKGFDFREGGRVLQGAYCEYQKKASKWTGVKYNSSAAVIMDEGDGMVYTDRSIDSYAYTTVKLDTSGKKPAVSYVGNSFILPVIDEVVVDGQTLKREDGDFVITYSKNNKPGMAKMTVTLTRGASEKTKSYPLGGSKTFTFKIENQKNKGLKL